MDAQHADICDAWRSLPRGERQAFGMRPANAREGDHGLAALCRWASMSAGLGGDAVAVLMDLPPGFVADALASSGAPPEGDRAVVAREARRRGAAASKAWSEGVGLPFHRSGWG